MSNTVIIVEISTNTFGAIGSNHRARSTDRGTGATGNQISHKICSIYASSQAGGTIVEGKSDRALLYTEAIRKDVSGIAGEADSGTSAVVAPIDAEFASAGHIGSVVVDGASLEAKHGLVKTVTAAR